MSAEEMRLRMSGAEFDYNIPLDGAVNGRERGEDE
jgi:hypothetical protein